MKCILSGSNAKPSGQEGLIDVHIIQSLYQSARSGKSVQLKNISKHHRPTKKQEIKRPAPSKSRLVHAKAPKAS